MTEGADVFERTDCEALLRLLSLSRRGFGAPECLDLLFLFESRSWWVHEFRLACVALLSKNQQEAVTFEVLFDQALLNRPRPRQPERRTRAAMPAATGASLDSGFEHEWWTNYHESFEEPELLPARGKPRNWPVFIVIILAVLVVTAATLLYRQAH